MASRPSEDGVQLTVEPDLGKLRERHRARTREIGRLELPHKKAGAFLDRWVQENFKTEGGKVGGWAPLRAGGRFVGGVLDSSAKVLQDTGRLRISFLPFATRRNAGIGSDVPYAKKHERGEGGLPVRRMLPKRGEVIKDINAIYKQHVRESLKK